ncbi:MAG TPA: hypothetical protein VF713_07580 [Thermoanaerobaculia bacterium]
MAAAAIGPDTAFLQIADRFRSRFDGSQDVTFVFCAAEADDHSIHPSD